MAKIVYIGTTNEWTGGIIATPGVKESDRYALSYEGASRMTKEDLNFLGLDVLPDPTPVDPTPDEIKAMQLATSLSPIQFHAMLRISNQYDNVLAIIAAMPSPDKEVATAKLDYSTNFMRNDSLVERLRRAISMPPDQLDALWIAALSVQ